MPAFGFRINILFIFAVQNRTFNKSNHDMLIIDVKDNESIDKALKKYKRKFERAGILKELRNRKHFTKKSVTRRAELLKAAYRLEKYGNNN